MILLKETSCAKQTWGRPFGGYNSPPSWTMSQWQQEQWQRKSQIRILEYIVYDLAAKIENKILLYCLRLVWQVEADVQVVVPILSKDRQDYQTLLCTSLEKDLLVDLTRICGHSLTQVCQAQVLHLHQYWQTLCKKSLDMETCCPRTVLKEKTFIWSGVTAITPSLISGLYISKQFVAGVLVSMEETLTIFHL